MLPADGSHDSTTDHRTDHQFVYRPAPGVSLVVVEVTEAAHNMPRFELGLIGLIAFISVPALLIECMGKHHGKASRLIGKSCYRLPRSLLSAGTYALSPSTSNYIESCFSVLLSAFHVMCKPVVSVLLLPFTCIRVFHFG